MVAEGGVDGSGGEVVQQLGGDVLQGVELGRAALVPHVVARRVSRPHDVVKLHNRCFVMTLNTTDASS